MSSNNRPSRTRKCIVGCDAAVVARCVYRVQREHALCGVGLCERHRAPGTLCPTHAGTGELRCDASGVDTLRFPAGAIIARDGEVYCGGCRVVVPVVKGIVSEHGKGR